MIQKMIKICMSFLLLIGFSMEIKGEEKELLKMVYSINHSDIIPDSLFLSNSIYYLEENGDIRVITSEKMKP